MAHRNRWSTVLKNGGSFHGFVKEPDGITYYLDIFKLSIVFFKEYIVVRLLEGEAPQLEVDLQTIINLFNYIICIYNKEPRYKNWSYQAVELTMGPHLVVYWRLTSPRGPSYGQLLWTIKLLCPW
jgi:hypothetical protein